MASIEQPVILRASDPRHIVADSFDDEGRLWILLGLTPETDRQVEELAARTGDSKASLINKALGLYKAASDAFHQGKQVGIADGEQELETEFIDF